MFKMSRNSLPGLDKGNFTMKFANGYTLSLAMGTGIYSTGDFDEGFVSVEAAAWDADGNWVKLGAFDDVAGWQSTDDVLAIMNHVASL